MKDKFTIRTPYIPCNLLATTPLALSRGVSPSLLAMDTRAPAATNSSAIAWSPQKQA